MSAREALGVLERRAEERAACGDAREAAALRCEAAVLRRRIAAEEQGDRNDLAGILAARRADPALPAWPDDNPTLAEMHADDVIRGVIRINDYRVMGAYSILRPDPGAVGRWLFVCAKPTRELAEAWCEGYCARRDEAL